MITKKELITKLWTHKVVSGLSVLALLLGVGGLVRAEGGFDWGQVQEGVIKELAQSQLQTALVSEPSFGALSSPDITSPYLCVNDDCTYSVVKTSRASTTIFSITDPFLMATSTSGDVVVTPTNELVNGIGQTGATSTVELVRISVATAPTSTYSVMCATAPTPYATSSLSQAIIETGTSVTSTAFIESGFYNPANSGVGVAAAAPWFANASTTFPKVMLTPATPYLICKVNASATNAFIDNPNPVLKLLVRVSRLRF